MTGKKAPPRARASILERLVDGEPGRRTESPPLRTLDRRRLRESVRENLSWIFNTRTPLPGARFDREALTLADFGIPDFGAIFSADTEGRRLLAARLTRAVIAWEPRLSGTEVTVFPDPETPRRLLAVLTAEIVVEAARTPVSFKMNLDRSGEVSVDEDRPK